MANQDDPQYAKQHKEELASLKDRYTLEEAADFAKKKLAKIIDFQGGKDNLMKYFVNSNLHLYHRRRHDKTNQEYFEILGASVEKKEEGIEKKLKENVEKKEDGN
jgi:hypothetical protein